MDISASRVGTAAAEVEFIIYGEHLGEKIEDVEKLNKRLTMAYAHLRKAQKIMLDREHARTAALPKSQEPRFENGVEMCLHDGCVLYAGHVDRGWGHATRRFSQLACPHNVPNFGPGCQVCD